MDKEVQRIMEKLHISEQEALDVVECDRRIDKGEKMFELSPELSAGAKKARMGARQPVAYQFKPRERKANNDKRTLVEIISQAIQEVGTNVEVTNIEREINFLYNNTRYKIVLSAPRK